MISKNSIENLKNIVDIVDVLSQFVQLKKSGANFKACCPFHGEDTPSFVVSPQKQIYHCFGCGVTGDSISFLMEYEKLTYPESIEKLSSMYNFNLEYENSNYKKQDLSILNKINSFYVQRLSTNNIAMKYLKERGVWESSIEKFSIGYAPTSNITIEYLKNNMFNLNDAKDFGIIDNGSNGIYARLIERIIFPIYTHNGNICGFGGRTIVGHNAKYINSPQTKLFNKSRLLYGYNLASKQIFKKKQVIVTEGYLDVIMLHQAGFDNSVATLGTALTKDHLPMLNKGDPKIIVAYDGDNAGINAAYKASILLGQNNFEGGIVIFSNGQDPADMVQAGQIESLNKIFNQPKPFIPFVIDTIVSKYNLKDPIEKQKCLNEIKDFTSSLSKMIQDEYRKYVALKLDIDVRHISKATNKRIKSNNMQTVQIDIAELNIIKTALESKQFYDTILSIVDITMFQTHHEEFKLLLEDSSNQSLTRITLNEELKTYDSSDLESQLTIFLIRYYTKKINHTKHNPDIDFRNKATTIRNLQENINKLKKEKLLL